MDAHLLATRSTTKPELCSSGPWCSQKKSIGLAWLRVSATLRQGRRTTGTAAGRQWYRTVVASVSGATVLVCAGATVLVCAEVDTPPLAARPSQASVSGATVFKLVCAEVDAPTFIRQHEKLSGYALKSIPVKNFSTWSALTLRENGLQSQCILGC